MQRQLGWTTRLAGVALACLACGAVAADDKIVPRPTVENPAQAAEEKAIRATAAALTKAFNAGDAKAIAALFTPEADYVDDEGQEFRGREAIEKEFALAFLKRKGLTVELTIDSIRLLSKEVAIENGTARVRPASGERGHILRFTNVLVKRDGQWLLESVRESPYMPSSNYEYLSDLEWLVGAWSAQNGDAAFEMKCDWAGNRNFLHCTLAVKSGTNTLSTSTKVIGWDSVLGQVRSWSFDSDGGFGSELWAKDGKRWLLKAAGVRREGGRTEAKNFLTPGNTDAFTWQSTERRLEGAKLPDTAEVKFVRVRTKK